MTLYHNNLTAVAMAEHLASYISDPSTIRIRVLEHFGRAPSVEECRKIRARVSSARSAKEQPRRVQHDYSKFACGHSRDLDNITLRPNGTESCKTCRRALEVKAAARAAAQQQTVAERAQSLWSKPITRPRLVDETLDVIASAFGLTTGELIGEDRHRHIVDARAVAVMVFLQSGNSLPWIARKLRRKCHTTIINLRDTWDHRCKRNPSLLAVYKAVTGE